MLGCKDLHTSRLGFLIEGTMSAEVTSSVAVRRLPQVGRLIRIFGLPGLLRFEAGPGQIAIKHAGGNSVRDQRDRRARSDPILPTIWMVRGVRDSPGSDLGLIDRRYRLSALGKPREHPG